MNKNYRVEQIPSLHKPHPPTHSPSFGLDLEYTFKERIICVEKLGWK